MQLSEENIETLLTNIDTNIEILQFFIENF